MRHFNNHRTKTQDQSHQTHKMYTNLCPSNLSFKENEIKPHIFLRILEQLIHKFN